MGSIFEAFPSHVLRRFATFLLAPELPAESRPQSSHEFMALLVFLLLLLIAKALFVLILYALAAAGYQLPSNDLGPLDPVAVLAIVLVTPLIEEIGFRSWLTGRPAVLSLLVTSFLSYSLYRNVEGMVWPVLVLIGGLAIAVAVRNRPRPSWFAKSFPALFYLSSTAFAGMHLLNQENIVFGPELLLMFPQLIGGLVYGYSRVMYGFWSASALHMANNGAFLALMVTG